VSIAFAIALGTTSLSDIAVLAHLAPVPGTRRAGLRCGPPLDLAGTAASVDRLARARTRVRLRGHARQRQRRDRAARARQAARFLPEVNLIVQHISDRWHVDDGCVARIAIQRHGPAIEPVRAEGHGLHARNLSDDGARLADAQAPDLRL
jgi:hypothetical protein